MFFSVPSFLVLSYTFFSFIDSFFSVLFFASYHPFSLHPTPDPGNSPSRVSSSCSSTDVDSSSEHPLQKNPHTNSSLLCHPDFACGSAPRSPSTLPRSYVTAARAGSRDGQPDSPMMQHSVERKKEVFLDHLRQKYPHHAAIILGHQDRMREQVRLKLCQYALASQC